MDKPVLETVVAEMPRSQFMPAHLLGVKETFGLAPGIDGITYYIGPAQARGFHDILKYKLDPGHQHGFHAAHSFEHVCADGAVTGRCYVSPQDQSERLRDAVNIAVHNGIVDKELGMAMLKELLLQPAAAELQNHYIKKVELSGNFSSPRLKLTLNHATAEQIQDVLSKVDGLELTASQNSVLEFRINTGRTLRTTALSQALQALQQERLLSSSDIRSIGEKFDLPKQDRSII